jgi:hypothetical protein
MARMSYTGCHDTLFPAIRTDFPDECTRDSESLFSIHDKVHAVEHTFSPVPQESMPTRLECNRIDPIRLQEQMSRGQERSERPSSLSARMGRCREVEDRTK